MPSISAVVALAGFAAFSFELGSGFIWGIPPHKTRPIVSQYFGRLTFLTTQTNVIGVLYFAAALGGLAVPA